MDEENFGFRVDSSTILVGKIKTEVHFRVDKGVGRALEGTSR